MRGVCRYCQPQEYIDVVQQAFMDFADDLKQRTWVGLTNDEVNNIAAGCHLGNSVQDAIFRAEQIIKEKNT